MKERISYAIHKKGYEKHDVYTDLALSYTVTSRELVRQVPMAARVSGCIFRDSVPKTLFIEGRLIK